MTSRRNAKGTRDGKLPIMPDESGIVGTSPGGANDVFARSPTPSPSVTRTVPVKRSAPLSTSDAKMAIGDHGRLGTTSSTVIRPDTTSRVMLCRSRIA